MTRNLGSPDQRIKLDLTLSEAEAQQFLEAIAPYIGNTALHEASVVRPRTLRIDSVQEPQTWGQAKVPLVVL